MTSLVEVKGTICVCDHNVDVKTADAVPRLIRKTSWRQEGYILRKT